jgi:hypothetical protein
MYLSVGVRPRYRLRDRNNGRLVPTPSQGVVQGATTAAVG